MEAMPARTDLYKTQLEVFGQMHQTNPSRELVAAVKDATEAFNAAGGVVLLYGANGRGP